MKDIIKNNKVVNLMFFTIGSLFFQFLGLFVKIDDKKILLSSGMGKFIGDSPKFIYDKMKTMEKYDSYRLIWAVEDVGKYGDEYDVVKLDSPSYFYHALSSIIWITSVNIERGLRFKKRHQYYINTWHGIPLKYIGLDVKSRNDYRFKQIDLFLTSGSYEENIYKDAFTLKSSQMHRVGLPRNIELETFKESKRLEVLKQLGLESFQDKKLILFAPTWKDYKYEQLNLNKLSKELNDEYLILMKSHPLEKINSTGEKVINVDHISDVPSLMKISDIVISDYSSIMIDYSLLNRPIFAYVPDYETYKSKRGLYVNKNELAPNVCNNIDELIQGINNIDIELETSKTREYSKFYLEVSAKRSIEKVTDKIDSFLLS